MNLPNSLTVTRICLVPLLVVVLLTKFEGRQILGIPTELVGAGIFLSRIAGLVRAAAVSGTTVVLGSHDMPLVAEVADRVVVMDAGRVVADGPPREILADPGLADKTRLAPPQITQLAAMLPGRAGRSAVLSVQELVAELRGTT